jgi:hypothetical protein
VTSSDIQRNSAVCNLVAPTYFLTDISYLIINVNCDNFRSIAEEE